MIALIWAMDENRVIGLKNKLPWHYPEDLKYFNRITRGKKVLMGKETYDSMMSYFPSGNLPYEEVYVASKSMSTIHHGIIIDDVEQFLKSYHGDIFVLGGAKIYDIALKYADVLYITYILNRYDGDTHFPKYSLKHFKLSEYQIKPQLILTKYERK
ncbi:MAG: dihydrofolate reductase [Acholeplasmataceae bacterium]